MRPAARIRGASARGARLTAAIPREARPNMRPALTPAVWGASSGLPLAQPLRAKVSVRGGLSAITGPQGLGRKALARRPRWHLGS
jgi:hypothetical protein